MYNFRTDLALERNEIIKKKDNLQNIEGIETEENKIDDNLVVSKVKIVNDKGAEVIGKPIGNYITIDLNKLNMKIYEFTRVLGILLDNAIEASKECDEKIINIEIRKESKRNRQILLIENTYSNKNIDTEKIFEKKYSTKKGNSGLGLWEVRKILTKNTNLNLFTSKNDIFFKQQLEMYNM